MGGSPWTEQELALVLGTKSNIEAARLTGRTVSAVEHARARANNGDPGFMKAHIQWDSGDPGAVGNRRLLARTCSECGFFLDAKFFNVTYSVYKGVRRTSWRGVCAWCRSKSVVRRRQQRMAQDPSFAAKVRTHDKRRGSREFGDDYRGDRLGQEWTEFDHGIASDPTRTVFEKALLTKRSIKAIRKAASKNGYKSLPKRSLGSKHAGQWLIQFPNNTPAQ